MNCGHNFGDWHWLHR